MRSALAVLLLGVGVLVGGLLIGGPYPFIGVVLGLVGLGLVVRDLMTARPPT